MAGTREFLKELLERLDDDPEELARDRAERERELHRLKSRLGEARKTADMLGAFGDRGVPLARKAECVERAIADLPARVEQLERDIAGLRAREETIGTAGEVAARAMQAAAAAATTQKTVVRRGRATN